jgi:hypothetical protein
MMGTKENDVHKISATFVAILVAFAVAVLGSSLAGAQIEPPPGPAPSVDATEVEEAEPFVPSFQEGEDEPAPAPNHPPIDEIPPMPMPEDTDEVPASMEPLGGGTFYDMITGETVTVPVDELALFGGSGQGGGYSGADGGQQDLERLIAGFDTMSVQTNTEDHPWRMNVKVVMRWGSSYAVCSGTMRDAETVLTAGHCVYDYGGAGWADDIWVYPGWDGVGGQFNSPPSIINPYGYGRSTHLGAGTNWVFFGDLDADVGVIGVDRAVGALTGWFGWAYGGSCGWHTAEPYNNASYPAQNCPTPGLHNGSDMTYWFGNFDSCPGNRLQMDTTPGCYTAVWGGMSGSGAYFFDDGNRYVHAVCSTSDRAFWGRYCRQWEGWVDWTNTDFIPDVRGSSFDLQPLDVNAEPTTILAGARTTDLDHLAANPTNGSASGTWTFTVRLSTNDFISSADTLLSTQFYSHTFNPMTWPRIYMEQVTIPVDTPEGDYFIGVLYDSATDGNSANNATHGWDAVPIHVTACPVPATPSSITYPFPPSPDPECDGAFTVDWPSVAGATSYTLQRATNSSFIGAITVHNGSNSFFNQSGLGIGTYYYRVRANRTCGVSTRSSGWRAGSSIVVSSTPATPSSINHSLLECDGNVPVSWSSVSGATSYTLQRSEPPTPRFLWIPVFDGFATSFTDRGVPDGMWYYRVRATNDCGSGGWKLSESPVEVNRSCDDGDACTRDICLEEGCVYKLVVCTDRNACTIDSCDPELGCVFTPIVCNDRDRCTEDSCDPATGECVFTPIECDDGDACTEDSCDPATGECVFTPIECDDDNACTEDSCDPELGCVFKSTCDDGDPCTADICDPRIGECTFEPEPEGTVCGNGMECDGEGNCEVTCMLAEREWTWNKTENEPDYDQVMMAPVAADLDGNGIPDVIFSTFKGNNWQGDGILRAISGADGSELFSVTDRAYRVHPGAEPAVADIDDDGRPEIMVSKDGGEIICFEDDGSFKWETKETGLGRLAIAVANLDQEGTPEIIAGRTVLNSNGTVRWTGTGSASYASAVADLDGDGRPEVVTDSHAYTNVGTIHWGPSAHAGRPAIGNFDKDPFPEIVSVGGDQVSLTEHDGTLKWGPVAMPGGGGNGPPVVADIDGDGWPEIGVGGRDYYVAFETDGSIKWMADIRDYSSRAASSSAFDFDQDGRAEIVYSDELRHRIFRGTDGAVLFEVPGPSGTVIEQPIILDVDNDGHVEIVFAVNNYAFPGNTGIEVYGNDSCWPGAREIWNQHTYHITNIGDDAAVPIVETNNWEVFNNYRTQATTAPVTLGDLDCNGRFDGTDVLIQATLVVDLISCEEDLIMLPCINVCPDDVLARSDWDCLGSIDGTDVLIGASIIVDIITEADTPLGQGCP